MVYIAHTSEDSREQTNLEHLNATAALCEKFAEPFGAQEYGRLAGLAHDLGKYSDAFQRRLRGNTERVDHSTAGAAECCKIGQDAVAFAVAGHHGGIPDGGGKGDSPDETTYIGRMKRAAQGKLEKYDAWQQELSLPNCPRQSFSKPFDEMFFTRMLYSCLVDADFLDTEAFMTGEAPERGGVASVETMEKLLLEHTAAWFPPKAGLNNERCKALENCYKQGEMHKPGLFTLTIPTGGGKTIASMAFALRHAHVNGLRRIIYVIPYTSIIEQNAKVFRNIFGSHNVLEHHSNVTYDIDDELYPEKARLVGAAENWDMPVIVTTAVQFFESLFSNRPSKCRKLHNLAKSVIIFDEAQMLPVSYLRPCVCAIAQLVKSYGVSAVLCTATQPALDEMFHEFLQGQAIAELCPHGMLKTDVFKRVIFQNEGKISFQDLAREISLQKQALCIVNRRKSAYDIYSMLNGDGVFHLSTLMFPIHRKAVIEKIRDRLAQNLPCIVVSTSLIEAGVDVDFPRVFREEAGLDSILQAAGRCNREGKRPAEESIVSIFKSDTRVLPMFEIPVEAGKRALSLYMEIDSPEAINYYFRELRDLKGVEAFDKMDILGLPEKELMPFKKISERFHLIDNDTKTVYIPLGEGRELVHRLRCGEYSRALFRALGQYCVSIYPQHFSELYQAGDIEMLENGAAILTNLALYDYNTGLSLKAEYGKADYL